MASATSARRSILIACMVLLIAATLVPGQAAAAPLDDAANLPGLGNFAAAVENGEAGTLRGVYAEDVFALPIIQQPANDAGFVSRDETVLTEFRLAADYGNVGVLAHNDLGGQYFAQLAPGQRVQLIYGDGRIEYFRVTHSDRYQATSPSSMYSDFIDLDTQEYLTAGELFAKVYMGPRHITFQTCVSNAGNLSWGRLFVFAEPEVLYTPLRAE
jgi:hypothetical protein